MVRPIVVLVLSVHFFRIRTQGSFLLKI